MPTIFTIGYEQATQPALVAALVEAKRTCLLCFCRGYDKCHRALLFGELFADFERVDLEPSLLP